MKPTLKAELAKLTPEQFFTLFNECIQPSAKGPFATLDLPDAWWDAVRPFDDLLDSEYDALQAAIDDNLSADDLADLNADYAYEAYRDRRDEAELSA